MTSCGRGLGVVSVLRSEGGSLPAHQIQLLQTFADQAVIAIENARLFNETQEALERQTATSEILKVIAASPSESAPVFEAIAHTAKRLLDGYSSVVWRFEGEIGHLAAFTPTNPEADAALRAASPATVSEFPLGEPLGRGEIVQIPDTEDAPQRLRDLARVRGYRAMLFVPLMQKGSGAGLICVTRAKPGQFDHRGGGPPQDLRRPSRDRDRERAALQRDARGAGSAKGLSGGARRNQQVGRGTRRRCSRPFWTRASGCSAPRRSASARSATTTWCASRPGAARGPMKSGATSRRSAKASPGGSFASAACTTSGTMRPSPIYPRPCASA